MNVSDLKKITISYNSNQFYLLENDFLKKIKERSLKKKICHLSVCFNFKPERFVTCHYVSILIFRKFERIN